MLAYDIRDDYEIIGWYFDEEQSHHRERDERHDLAVEQEERSDYSVLHSNTSSGVLPFTDGIILIPNSLHTLSSAP